MGSTSFWLATNIDRSCRSSYELSFYLLWFCGCCLFLLGPMRRVHIWRLPETKGWLISGSICSPDTTPPDCCSDSISQPPAKSDGGLLMPGCACQTSDVPANKRNEGTSHGIAVNSMAAQIRSSGDNHVASFPLCYVLCILCGILCLVYYI